MPLALPVTKQCGNDVAECMADILFNKDLN